MGLKLNKTSKDYTDDLEDLDDSLSGIEDVGEESKALQDDTTMLLYGIIKELKIMNLHLSILTDNTIEKTEVE